MNEEEILRQEAFIEEEQKMFENMQYYMEYCQENDYVTPQEWLINHKHF